MCTQASLLWVPWLDGVFHGCCRSQVADKHALPVTSALPLDKAAASKQFVIKLSPLSSQQQQKKQQQPTHKKRKKTPEERNADALYAEHLLYQHLLHGVHGIPMLPPGAYGEDQGYRFLVMERLGRTLEDVKRQVGRIPVKTAAQLGLELLELLKTLHTKGLIYVDVKPENFMLGLGKETQIYCVDFGLSERVRLATGKHKPFKQGMIVGTPTFLSLNCHNGATASRRDDIEALLYVLLYLIRGDLPWQQARSDAEGAKIKQDTSLDELCKGFPKQWKLMLQKIRACGFEDKPDYDFFAKQFESLGAKSKRDSKEQFDWGVKRGSQASAAIDTCRSPPPKRTKSTPTGASAKKQTQDKSTTQQPNKRPSSTTTPAAPQQHNRNEKVRQDDEGDEDEVVEVETPSQVANEVEYVMTLQPDPRRRRKAAATAIAAAAAAKALALKAHNSTGRYNLRRRSTENTSKP